MSDVFQRAKRAIAKELSAREEKEAAERELDEAVTMWRSLLPVGPEESCAVAILPSGRIVVHCLVDSVGNSEVFCVNPRLFNEDGSSRQEFDGEQIGGGRMRFDTEGTPICPPR